MAPSPNITLILETQQKAYKDATELLYSTLSYRIKEVEEKYADLVVSLQFTQKEVDELKQENQALKNDLVTQQVNKSQPVELEEKLEKLSNRVNFQEDYSRRNNIRIDGLDETPNETWEVTQMKVQRLFRDKMGLEDPQLERAHRVGPPHHRHATTPQRTRTIVARFVRFSDREKALRNSNKLKNTKIYLNEDLCEASVQARKLKFDDLKQARREGKIAYFSHTRLIIKNRTRQQGSPTDTTTPQHHSNLRVTDISEDTATPAHAERNDLVALGSTNGDVSCEPDVTATSAHAGGNELDTTNGNANREPDVTATPAHAGGNELDAQDMSDGDASTTDKRQTRSQSNK